MAKWPDSTNTGVPDGVTLLPSGGIVVTKAGTVLSGLDIKGTIYIAADNVTVENCKITAAAFSVVQIKVGQVGVTIKDCDINGVGTNNDGSNGITGVGTFLRNNIYNVENGFNIAAGRGTVIEGNYIHDLKASGPAHYDGIQIDGGQSDIVIRHNTVINDHGQTAALMIDNGFGPVSNVLVTDNLLVGGGYTIYADAHFNNGALSNITITNNHLGEGYYGTLNANGSSPVYTGNVMDGDALVTTLNNQADVPGTPTTIPDPTPVPPASGDASDGSDNLNGDGSNNVIDGKGGNDAINGGAGNDTLFGGTGFDRLTGGAAADIFAFRTVGEIGDKTGARDVIADFVSGTDKIDLSAIDANIDVTGKQGFTFLAGDDASFTHKAGELAWHTEASGNRTIVQGDVDGDGIHDFEIELSGRVSLTARDFSGLAGGATSPTQPTPPTPTPPDDSRPDPMTGTGNSDRLSGTSANEYLSALGGDDTLNGGGGSDTLDGGLGRDVMSGGSGRDIFVFKSAAETGSSLASRDVITDFAPREDKIDVSAIDANSALGGNQTFAFLAGENQAFTKHGGELAWHFEEAQNRTIIQGDVNGDGIHDFEIQLTGLVNLTAGDLVL